MTGTNTAKNNFVLQMLLSLIIILAVMALALWRPLLSVPIHNNFPVTADVIAHLGKVTYIADCLKNLHWPSWFPYWYNGTTVGQYYPPLSFFILAPIQILFNNVMITFKFYVLFYLLIGAMGVWYICYRWFGYRWGIIAGILYGLYPFLIRSLAAEGVMAQGPIFAFTPWLLAATLLFAEKRSALRAFLVSLFTGILILSHAMHAFIMCLAIGILFFMLVIYFRFEFRNFIYWGIAVGLGAGLVSFWWMPGVTPFEDPLVPYVLPENALNYAAHFDWFFYGYTGDHYFSPILLILSLCSLFLLKINTLNNNGSLQDITDSSNQIDTKALIKSLAISLFIILIISFGYHVPILNHLPFSSSIFFGRILTFAIILVLVLIVIFLRELWHLMDTSYWRIIRPLVFAFIVLIIVLDINPIRDNIRFQSFADTQSITNQIPLGGGFNSGRIEWCVMHGPDVVYFPMLKGINSVNGSAIEGTPHNRAFWLNNSAINADCGDYVMKNILQWNVRAVIVQNDFTALVEALPKYGFHVIRNDNFKSVYISDTPSSYFIKQERNSLAIGRSSSALVLSFPWLIQGLSNTLEDYSIKDLDKFKLIYLSEPVVKDFNKFQTMIESLAQSGKTVIVEMGSGDAWPLLGIIPYNENIPNDARLVPTAVSPIRNSFALQAYPVGNFPAMGNLDGIWMEMVSGDKRVPVIGFKNVGKNRVYYVGMRMGLHLNSETKWIEGHDEKSIDSKEIYSVFTQLLDMGKPYENIVPHSFPVFNTKWWHNGFEFSYNSTQRNPVVVSVTYTPRWKATIDGMPLSIDRHENLVLLDLPAGKHTVSCRYGMTWVGWTGVVLSLITLMIYCIIFWRWEYWMSLADRIKLKTRNTVIHIGS